MRLKNKVAIITGGTSGMGKATAILFAKEGAKVVICGRRSDLGEQIAKGIRNKNGDAVFIKADVSKEKDVKELVNYSVTKYSKIDVLFNNAGINEKKMSTITDETKNSWDNILDVNLNGMFLMIKYVIAEMVKVGKGSIINNSSVLSFQANKIPSTSYHASKGAVTSLTKKVAIDYAKNKIRVNYTKPYNVTFVAKKNKAMYFNKDLMELHYFNPNKTAFSMFKSFFELHNMPKDTYKIVENNNVINVELKKIEVDNISNFSIIFQNNPIELKKIKWSGVDGDSTFSIYNLNSEIIINKKTFSMLNPIINN